jgi:hypothetical protein
LFKDQRWNAGVFLFLGIAHSNDESAIELLIGRLGCTTVGSC